jgi:hypothetical protein
MDAICVIKLFKLSQAAPLNNGNLKDLGAARCSLQYSVPAGLRCDNGDCSDVVDFWHFQLKLLSKFSRTAQVDCSNNAYQERNPWMQRSIRKIVEGPLY